jgi:YhcH/YjgK/YiaL family protein
MIIDTIQNAFRYYSIHPLFEQAFNWVQKTDLLNVETGTIPIAEGLKVIVSDGQGKTKEDSLKKFECHDKNIDIQLCIRGNETIGWKPREKCVLTNGDYNADKDVRFFNDEPDMYFQLTDGQYVIFFPEDVHAPMIGTGTIKKFVFKVTI